MQWWQVFVLLAHCEKESKNLSHPVTWRYISYPNTSIEFYGYLTYPTRDVIHQNYSENNGISASAASFAT
eukprot:scaffold6207_cov90-Skeletonema_marinoi.AAC.5